MSVIRVSRLCKQYQVLKKGTGFLGTVKQFFRSEYETKKAVTDISFEVEKGEMIGFIGPNGAGKSTTIKMLSGILVPSSGEVWVNGKIPHKHRMENAANIGVVFGQRTQLWWDLPLSRSIELLKYVYKITDDLYKRNFRFLSELLEVQDFIDTPVRQLSLGQRMRGDLMAALIHDPVILFLDEPTIGLDVIAKDKIRQLLADINREKQVSCILTTHDMMDIEKTCNRMVVIDKGTLIYDGGIDRIKDNYGKIRRLIVDFKTIVQLPEWPGVRIVKQDGLRVSFEFQKDQISASEVLAMVSKRNEVLDLTVEEPQIDDIIKEIYEFSNRNQVAL